MKETKWVTIGRLPVMVNSNLCWLHKLQESDCQFDSGGYFLIKGMEKVLPYMIYLVHSVQFLANVFRKKHCIFTLHSSFWQPLKKLQDHTNLKFKWKHLSLDTRQLIRYIQKNKRSLFYTSQSCKRNNSGTAIRICLAQLTELI